MQPFQEEPVVGHRSCRLASTANGAHTSNERFVPAPAMHAASTSPQETVGRPPPKIGGCTAFAVLSLPPLSIFLSRSPLVPFHSQQASQPLPPPSTPRQRRIFMFASLLATTVAVAIPYPSQSPVVSLLPHLARPYSHCGASLENDASGLPLCCTRVRVILLSGSRSFFLLTVEYVSIVRRRADCASGVIVSASSRMITLNGGHG